MTIEQMQEQKKRLKYTYQQISMLSGVPKNTVQKVLGGFTKNPRANTLKAIEGVLDTDDASRGRYASVQKKQYMLGEEAVKYDTGSDGHLVAGHQRVPVWAQNSRYPWQGNYTIEDYLAIPDGQRVELIDGVIYDMASPLTVHQVILSDLITFFTVESRKHSGCHAFCAPFDVQLDSDDRTMVQPDVFLVCHPERIYRERVIGAPDLVIEILSPSTRKKDIEVKYGEYAHAGVQEYWMVDPDRQQIYVTVFADDDRIAMYAFDDRVPVWISGGEVTVDFSEIRKDIAYIDTLDDD
ncbi:MAG: Uma2 family endonuclease [Lachnospiraceae bacterium]|nr:Uma2 family endonuclease [Lachnospiraceae bacterium]